jgi:hypothetical protein
VIQEPQAPPSTAKVANALQWAVVGMLLLIAAVAIAGAVHYDSLIDQAARVPGASATDVEFERSWNVSGTWAILVPTLLLAMWLGVCAWFARRRSNVARILTLVGLGAPIVLSVLACLAAGFMGVVFSLALASSEPVGLDDEGFTDSSGQAFTDELDRLNGGGWSIAFDIIGATAGLLALLLGIATGVLLLVRTTAHWFRPPVWKPAHPYPPYWPGYCPPPPAPYWYPAPPAPPGETPPPRQES